MIKMNPEYNSIYDGDAIEIMSKFDDSCFDHCITDPPYNISKENGLAWAFSSHITMSEEWDTFSRSDYLEFTGKWLKEIMRVVKPNGNIFIFGSYHNIYDIGYIVNEFDLRIINSITWLKPNAQPNITCRMLTESTEHIIWICNAPKDKAKAWAFNYDIAKRLNDGKQMRNMWEIPYPSIKERRYGKHPSQKPLDLITRIVLIATNENDSILDCFGGSGTTGVVANSFGRRWVLIDSNTEYNEIAKRRIAKEKIPLPKELLQIGLGLKVR